MKSLLNVLCYTTRLLYLKYPRTLFPLISALYVVLASRNKKKVKVKLCPVPERLFNILVSRYVSKDFRGDADTCVLLSCNVLEALGVSGAPWLMLNKVDSKQGVKCKSRAVRAIPIPELDNTESVILTEVTWHNIRQNLNLLSVNDCCYLTNVLDVRWMPKENDIFQPNFADEANISLLQTTIDVKGDVIDSCLASYFRIPRYLCFNDVFSIDVLKYAPDFQYIFGYHNIRTLYFKVTKLDGPKHESRLLVNNYKIFGYYVSRDRTTVHQSVSLHELLPPSLYSVTNTSADINGYTYKSYLVPYCPSGLSSYFEELLDRIQPFISQSWLPSCVNPMFLLSGPKGVGKKIIVTSISKSLGLNLWCVDCLELQGNSPGQTEGKLKFVFTKVKEYLPCILMMQNIEVLCRDKEDKEDDRAVTAFEEELREVFSQRESLPALILIAASTALKESTSSIPSSIARMFLHTVYIHSPSEKERESTLNWLMKKGDIDLDDDLDISNIAARCSGFLLADLEALVSHAIRLKLDRMKNVYIKLSTEDSQEKLNQKLSLQMSDFESALDIMHASYSDAIGAPKIPAISWQDIGGLTSVKEEILQTITLPLQYPELVESGLRRSGVLLYGPPGTGKTLLAKAVATECNLNFLSVKGPELLNMYVGQSEENVREVFQRARDASPCIIFFDELDSLAPNRGRSGDSGGVMDRVVSQLLAELDGMQKSTHLFVIGATNRPDLIDPALLRPGRFDKLLYVGVYEDKTSQLSVMKALTRKFEFTSGFSMEKVVEVLPQNLTGADMYSICSSAWLGAVRRRIQDYEKDNKESSREKVRDTSPVKVDMEDFTLAIKNLVPSVTPEDLAYFNKLHKQLAVQKSII